MNYATYRKLWDNASKITPSIPLNIDVEISASCNLKCPFCFLQSKEYSKTSKRFMDFELAKDIIQDAIALGVPALKVNWRGESTIHPDFNKIMAFAHNHFLDLLINTNGNYLPEKTLGVACATKVMFSVDSFNPTTYKKMRPGGDLAKVISNIRTLIDFGHRNIWVRRVLTDSNKGEDFKSASAQTFGNSVKVAEHYCYDRAKTHNNASQRVYCGYPSQRLVIATNGDVFPCCVDYHGEMKLGNVKDITLAAIWKGFKLKAIRATLKDHKDMFISKQCKNCTSWMAYNAPERAKVGDKAI